MSTAYIQTQTGPTGHAGDVFSIAKNSKYLVSGDGEGHVLLWEGETSIELGRNKSGCHRVVATDKYIAAVYFDGTAALWDKDLEPVTVEWPKAVWSAAISEQTDSLVAVTLSGEARVFNLLDLAAKPLVISPTGPSVATCCDISADGNFVAVGFDAGKVCVYSTATGNLAFTLPLHTCSPRSVAFSPLGSLIAVGGNVDSICLYSLNGGDLVGTLTGHTSWVFCVAWNATGEYLLSVGNDKLAKVWSIESRGCVSNLNDASSVLFAACFVQGGAVGKQGVVTAGAEGIMRWYREAAGA